MTCRRVVLFCVLLAAALTGVGAEKLALPFSETAVVKGSDVSADFAVKEFNFIVSNATGRAFAESGAAGRSGPERRIFVGRSPEAEKILGKDFFDALKDEESVVFAKGNDLFLVGGGQLGCLYAVYDFLEDNLGFRHYFWRDNGFVVDRVKEVVFSGKATRRRPAFTGYRIDHHEDRHDAVYEVRNRGNGVVVERLIPGYRNPYSNRISGHGFKILLPPDDIPPELDGGWSKEHGIRGEFKEHPEWFSLDRSGKRVKDAQLCLSNPGCREKLFENLLRFVKEDGGGNYMVGSNDDHNDRYCWCDGCVALEKKYGSVGGPLWDWILWACPKLQETGYTNVFVKTLAYKGPKQTERAPSGVDRFPKNFICDAAFLNSDRPLKDVPDMTLEDGTVFNRLENLKRWCEVCDHVAYWYYGGNNPAQVYSRVQEEMRELHRAGVKSVGACGTGGGLEFSDFTHWIFFRLLQDPYLDLEPDLRRIFALEYGPAAELVRRYVDALDACRRKAVETMPETAGTDVMYSCFSFLTGSDILAFRKLLDEALDLTKGTPYENHVRYARFGPNVWTIMMFPKVRACDPAAAAKIDLAALDAESRAAQDACVAEFRAGKLGRDLAIHSPVVALDQMVFYAKLKGDALPPELAQYPKDKVSRILPPKQRSMPVDPRHSVLTCLKDDEAAAGYAWYTYFDNPKLEAPVDVGSIRVECYDEGTRTWLFPAHSADIPLSRLVPGKYTLVRLGRQRVPQDYWLVFGGYWDYVTNIKSPSRLFDPTYANKEWEAWASVKAVGPKFFKDAPKDAKSVLLVDQLFYVDLGVPEGK